MEVVGVPGFEDNYHWILRCPVTGVVALVDPGDPEPVIAELARRAWRPSLLLNTHHHWDHVNGNARMISLFELEVVGAARDRGRIPGLQRGVSEGERIRVGVSEAQVLDTSGHTRGHVSFWFEKENALFCGDTMFSLGCGKLFEGTPDDGWRSLDKIRSLPPETKIYCAHEYTLGNAAFARFLEPSNQPLQVFVEKIREKRSRGEASVPSLLVDELRFNPFLRVDDPQIRKAAGIGTAEPDSVAFGVLRRAKDDFDAR